ncbi:acyl-CoA dehydrogenase [Microbacterium betulae]|uniref:Acyl-CoA dehydrogenase n=1 Tax=Microbacterium betulae TaxID=2981139 RepID=A0AA97FKE7_9MICO|nr:acyl-CoA dehydrogenase [Microbacterium sp. AB]WOF23945.1 acyl-CoA dehydrogenase [Microbacterium sp. AB]
MSRSVPDRPPLRALPPALDEALADVDDLAGFGVDLESTLAWVSRVGRIAPSPGEDTAALWELLASTSERDVGAARILEPHLDALAILDQARDDVADVDAVLASVDATDDATWGVFAAEGPAARVTARPAAGGGWTLTGTKPWCSLAGRLSHALLTAWVDDGRRGLFAVDLRAPEVSARPGPWAARGLSQVVSAPVDLEGAHAAPVGEPGWYLRRAGFTWGGMGVAAVWWGGTLPIVAALAAAGARTDADQLSALYAGRADAASWAASRTLAHAAAEIDERVSGADAALLAARVRAVVSRSVRVVLDDEAAALGPGPVAADESHSRRVADLSVYIRQDHADRDLARLGRLAVAEGRR